MTGIVWQKIVWQVTEEQLAAAFEDCGQVVDCRVCCDTNSAMRFAFIEFYHGDSVQKARVLSPVPHVQHQLYCHPWHDRLAECQAV